MSSRSDARLDATAPPLLLVGHRGGLGPALRSLERRAYLLVAHGRRPAVSNRYAGVAEVDLHGPAEPLAAAARELLGGRKPAAIVALAERTVLVSARLRECFGLPGNGARVALRCADKIEMKRAMESAGVPVARWRPVDEHTTADALVEALGLPLVLKPRRDSGGRGQRTLGDRAAVVHALAALQEGAGRERSRRWLAEGWVEGVEMSVESFVRGGAPLLQNPTEYLVRRHANIVPAELEPETWSAVRTFNERALGAAGVERGITHLELFRTRAGLVFGELAVRPPGGRIMPLLQSAWGFDPWEALMRLELGEEPAFPREPRRTAGAWVLHPGAGTVRSISGLEEARALPQVRRITLKVGAGASIPERVGTGQDIGSIQAEGPNRDTVAEALTLAHRTLRIALSPGAL